MTRCPDHDWPVPEGAACPECMLQMGEGDKGHGHPLPDQGKKSLAMAMDIARIPESAWPQFIRYAEEQSSYWHVIRDLRRFLAAGGRPIANLNP